MKIVKVAGLALAAVVTLAACSTNTALPITGEGVGMSYPNALSFREALLADYVHGGDNVYLTAQLEEACDEIAGLHNVDLTQEWGQEWQDQCASPFYEWDANTDTWHPVNG